MTVDNTHLRGQRSHPPTPLGEMAERTLHVFGHDIGPGVPVLGDSLGDARSLLGAARVFGLPTMEAGRGRPRPGVARQGAPASARRLMPDLG